MILDQKKAWQKGIAGTMLGAFVMLICGLPLEAMAVEQDFQGTATGGGLQSTATALGGTVGCVAQLAFTAGFGAVSGGAATAIAGGTAAGGAPVSDIGKKMQDVLSITTLNSTFGINLSNAYLDNFLGCIARAVARAALQQMAVSTVNWINSGFNGNPSFVTNYDQFFTNIADQAAGEIIQGSGLAFLCSPFKLQVRIALAQAYASGYTPRSCTLSQITNNIEGFMTNFSQGGWPAFLSFTTSPANNPFGAYLYGQTQIGSAVAGAQQTNTLDLTLGSGFSSFVENKDCREVQYDNSIGMYFIAGSSEPATAKTGQRIKDVGGKQMLCTEVQTTPGSVIDESLAQALGSNTQSLVGAKYFDEIINALISQLIQNVLYNGLSNLSEGAGYGYNRFGTIDNAALEDTVSANAPAFRDSANRVVAITNEELDALHSSITDLATLKQCWVDWATTTPNELKHTPLSDSARTTALQNASSTQDIINTWGATLVTYEQQLAKAQASLDLLVQYTDAVANAQGNSNALSGLVSGFSTEVARGTFYDSGSLNNALEEQTALSGKLTTLDAQTASSQATCNAYGAAQTQQQTP